MKSDCVRAMLNSRMADHDQKVIQDCQEENKVQFLIFKAVRVQILVHSLLVIVLIVYTGTHVQSVFWFGNLLIWNKLRIDSSFLEWQVAPKLQSSAVSCHIERLHLNLTVALQLKSRLRIRPLPVLSLRRVVNAEHGGVDPSSDQVLRLASNANHIFNCIDGDAFVTHERSEISLTYPCWREGMILFVFCLFYSVVFDGGILWLKYAFWLRSIGPASEWKIRCIYQHS